jgi:6-phospho-3-hexuloisomerase
MDKATHSGTKPWLAVGQEIADLLDRIDPAAFSAVVDIFHDVHRRWFLSGQGRSGLAAQMAAMRFMHLGRNVHFVGEATAPSIRKGDGLLIISGSGETPVSLSYAKIAKSEGASVVTLTHKPNGALSKIADAVLPVPVNTTKQLGGSLFEQTCLLLLDAIVMELAGALPDAHGTMAYRHTNLQ